MSWLTAKVKLCRVQGRAAWFREKKKINCNFSDQYDYKIIIITVIIISSSFSTK